MGRTRYAAVYQTPWGEERLRIVLVGGDFWVYVEPLTRSREVSEVCLRLAPESVGACLRLLRGRRRWHRKRRD